MTWTVLALPPVAHQEVLALFAGRDVEVLALPERTQDAVQALLPGTDVVIADWSPELRVEDLGPRVCLVQLASIGPNGVDPEALRRAGVPLANCPGGNSTSTAEWCVSATLALLRKTVQADAAVRAGQWPQTSLRGQELAGRTVGVIGMGATGRAAAQLFTAFGCHVRYWSRSQHPDAPVPYADLEDLLGHSDVVVVAIALGPDTHGLVDALRLAPGAILINGGRGAVVEETSLIAALQDGRLAGAALDVFPVEPLPTDSPLRTVPNLLLSPHMAGTTEQAATRLLHQAAANVHRGLNGEPVINVINGVNPHVRRRLPALPAAAEGHRSPQRT